MPHPQSADFALTSIFPAKAVMACLAEYIQTGCPILWPSSGWCGATPLMECAQTARMIFRKRHWPGKMAAVSSGWATTTRLILFIVMRPLNARPSAPCRRPLRLCCSRLQLSERRQGGQLFESVLELDRLWLTTRLQLPVFSRRAFRPGQETR
jgi:hypothetical protein